MALKGTGKPKHEFHAAVRDIAPVRASLALVLDDCITLKTRPSERFDVLNAELEALVTSGEAGDELYRKVTHVLVDLGLLETAWSFVRTITPPTALGGTPGSGH
jgi:predicted DNA-binding ArsR family transcriptional regulator